MKAILSESEVVELTGLPINFIMEMQRRDAFPGSLKGQGGERYWIAKEVLEYVRELPE